MTTTAAPEFNDLSEAEKRLVAERLMKIKQSNWKPFWCPDSKCNGAPHHLPGPLGNTQFLPETATHGPKNEPLGDLVYETPKGVRFTEADRAPRKKDRVVGRPILDPVWAHNHARVDQRLPPWNQPWTLFIMSGRGSGKTRTGTEFVTLSARRGLDGAIIGRRGTELVNTHVAALIEHAHPDFVPEYLASKDILVWPEVTLPDGTKKKPVTYLFSAERPENIRSINISYCWFDEAAFMPEIKTAWMNAKMATRIETPGNPLHILITSTPTATKWVMEMEDDDAVEIRRVSTYANRANLSDDFIDMMRKEYEGTRMGRQELHGEVLRDVEGSMWNDDLFVHRRFEKTLDFLDFLETLDDITVAVDPAGSKGPNSDATGIIAAGAQHTDEDGEHLNMSEFFVLGDATIKGTPAKWAKQTYLIARMLGARRIIAEKNFGGDMVKQVLIDYAKLHPHEARDKNGEEFVIEVVHASKSKETRAEATVGKYEQGRVTHVTNTTRFGDLAAMEKEQVTWVPKSRGGKSPSPNRVDALVWAIRDLDAKVRYVAQTASQSDVMSKLKGRVQSALPGGRRR